MVTAWRPKETQECRPRLSPVCRGRSVRDRSPFTNELSGVGLGLLRSGGNSGFAGHLAGAEKRGKPKTCFSPRSPLSVGSPVGGDQFPGAALLEETGPLLRAGGVARSVPDERAGGRCAAYCRYSGRAFPEAVGVLVEVGAVCPVLALPDFSAYGLRRGYPGGVSRRARKMARPVHVFRCAVNAATPVPGRGRCRRLGRGLRSQSRSRPSDHGGTVAGRGAGVGRSRRIGA